MDIKQIESLARIMSKNGLTELEINEGELKISLRKGGSVQVSQPDIFKAMPNYSESIPVTTQQSATEDKNNFSFNGLTEINSPIAGVYYSSASPELPPFVKVGDKVKKGDVLCIIEAMKLMNELTAEKDGEIADICAVNEQIVEYGQTLFTIY